jgi:uncharacterized protein YjiS (DUF1127 family)
MNGFTDIALFLKQQAPQAPAGLGRWALFRHRWITRGHLRELSARELADVGLTQHQQYTEGLKPFWQG